MGLLKDKNGKVSSKRVFGGLLAITAAGIAIYSVIIGYDCAGILWPLVTFAAALFGVTVAEKKEM
jgi:hypothetical protein